MGAAVALLDVVKFQNIKSNYTNNVAPLSGTGAAIFVKVYRIIHNVQCMFIMSQNEAIHIAGKQNINGRDGKGVMFIKNTFTNNTGKSGGALQCKNCMHLFIYSCHVYGNQAFHQGGAFCFINVK